MQDDNQPQVPSPAAPEDEPILTPNVSSPSPDVATLQPEAQPIVTPPSTPVAPEQPQPAAVISQDQQQAPVVAPQSSVVSMQPKRRAIPKPLAIAGIGVGAALLIGGGYIFGFYLPNRPENVFSASLTNTALGIDHLLDYGKLQSGASYKSMAFDGSLTVKSPGASMDATLTGSADQNGNGSSAMTADVMGQKLAVNMRTVHVQGDESPDVYLQVSGIKRILASSGVAAEVGDVGTLDGQWISIDHTLIDTYAARLKATDGTDETAQQALAMPTYAQLDDAARKVQVANKHYLFTTDSAHAVLTQQKFVGQEVTDGHTLNHYTVGYSKAHFAAYVDALKSALDSSSLNAWSKKANDGKSLSATLSLDSMKSDINSSKGDYTFDLWADTRTKLVSKVSFKNPDNPTDVFAISQGYTGGNNYPFTMTINTKDDSGNPQNAIINLGLDTTSHKVTLGMAVTSKASDGTTQINVALHATPSKDAVTASVPTGARSINDVLNMLGLGGLTDGSLPLGGSDTPLVFQQ